MGAKVKVLVKNKAVPAMSWTAHRHPVATPNVLAQLIPHHNHVTSVSIQMRKSSLKCHSAAHCDVKDACVSVTGFINSSEQLP